MLALLYSFDHGQYTTQYYYNTSSDLEKPFGPGLDIFMSLFCSLSVYYGISIKHEAVWAAVGIADYHRPQECRGEEAGRDRPAVGILP